MAPIRRRSRHDATEVTDLVRRLAKILDELRLTEAEMSWGDVRVRVQRAVAPVVTASTHGGAAAPPESVVTGERSGNLVTVEAPMVGTFYRTSSPTTDPYVREGDIVKEGQIVCIIEAMKLMNEIEVRAAGRVSKILVENGQAVEYGQPLFLIEPTR